ncbi:MAG: PepSY domain-containing protein [Actinomycetota bacterium]|nr:PepSY domain-containing protein [Actinomycetota bacterium]
MPLSRTRRLVYTGATALGLVAGTAGLAAATTQSSEPSATTAPSDEETGDSNPNYTSSITAPDNENEGNLAALATITADEAAGAATTATGGTAGETELENENGNVVYGVEITLPDGTKLDVKVDAGNAAVLAQETDDDETDDDETDD